MLGAPDDEVTINVVARELQGMSDYQRGGARVAGDGCVRRRSFVLSVWARVLQ